MTTFSVIVLSHQFFTYFSELNLAIGGPFILVIRMVLIFWMVSEFLRSVETMFIAEKPLSSSVVDIGIIFSTFIKGTKPAGIYLPSLSKYDLKRLRFCSNSRPKCPHRYLIGPKISTGIIRPMFFHKDRHVF
jgi:hypothetical protein